MAGNKELGVVKASSVRELANKIMLRTVRQQGHEYVELREDGKRHIFFCILCLSPCYSDDTLFNHLNGNLHRERYNAAKATLLLSNRWPFNDGVLFFHDSCEQDKQLAISHKNNSNLSHGKNSSSLEHVLSCNGTNLNGGSGNNDLSVPLNRGKNLSSLGHVLSSNGTNLNGGSGNNDLSVPFNRGKNLSSLGHVLSSNGTNLNGDSGNNSLSIPGVVIRDEISVLRVSFMGFGDISARISEGVGFSSWIHRIWCAWMGKDRKEDVVDMVRELDFAVITFPYTYDLGRSGIHDNSSTSPCSSAHTDTEISKSPRNKRKKSAYSIAQTAVETVQGHRKKRKKSFSDPEDISKSLSNQCGSSREGSVVSSSSTSDKILRKEIRQLERAAAERMCDVCQRKMLPGKDMATLLNMKTGRLACSSRNVNGAFHVFHTSCLIHWILICEFEIWKNQASNLETACETETETEDGKRATKVPISSVFCPECQGTGINIEGDQRQAPTVPVSQMFNHKLEASDAHRAWMKSPEILQNCSTGLCFPSQSEEMIKEKVLPLKFLRFYKADV